MLTSITLNSNYNNMLASEEELITKPLADYTDEERTLDAA